MSIISLLFWLLLIPAEHHGRVAIGGVPIPGATVTFTKGEQKLVTITNAMGAYAVPDLPDGTWTIQVDMLGFAPAKQDVTVGPGAPAAEWELNLLAMDQIHAEIAKTPPPAAAPSPAPTRAGPTPRAPNAFQRADVRESDRPAGAAAAPANEAPAPSAFANASQEDLSQRAADGLVINGSINNGAASQFGQAPRIGNNLPGQRSLYNGAFNLSVDTSKLDAQQYSLTGQDTPKPDFTKATGGFNFGGPLRIGDFLRNSYPTFFVGYSRVQNRNATTLSGRMPTVLERAGDFSQTRVQGIDPTGLLGDRPVQIINPSTGLPFVNGVIPAQLISPQARTLLELYPLPNFNGNARYNYQIPIVDATHTDSLQTRLNKTFNQKHSLNGNFDIQSTRSDASNLFRFTDAVRNKGMNGAVNWNYRPTPRSTATFRYQFNRQTSRAIPYFADKINVSGVAGISGNNQDAPYWGPPNLNFSTGFSPLTDGSHSFNRTQNHTVGYNGFWNHGRHNLTWGADFRRMLLNVNSQEDARGTFTFTGAATRSATDSSSGYDFADFLLGTPDTSSIAFGNADKYFRQSFYDGFLSDDWRVNGALTVNIGVRWEYEAPITELYDRLVNLDIASGFAAVAPVVAKDPHGSLTGEAYPDSLVHPDKFGIQPRLAFAWRPVASSSLLVRGGYGVYRNTNVYQSIVNQMAQQSPLSKNLSIANSPANPLTLANGFTAAPAATPNTFAINPNFRVGFAQTWTLSLQRDLPAGLQMTAMYLGTKGSRLPQEFLPNTFPGSAVSPSGYVYYTSGGNSNRQAGQIQLRRRLRNGFTATGQYTYAKSIDNAPLMAGGQVVSANQGGTSIAQNWLDLKGERARSNFDQRHQLSVQGQYTTGVGGRGSALLTGWKSKLLKEWTVASQMTLGSGLPQTPVYVAAVRGTGFTGTLRPDVTGAPLYAAPPGFFLNPAAYRVPAAGQWGNAGRNTITGPSQFVLNASLARTFRMNDRWNMDLQMSANNVLNHVTYANWVTTVGSAQFGLPSRANNMRAVQTSLRLRF